MPAALNNDILSHIVSILSEEYHEPYDPGHPYIQTETERINIKRAQEAKHALLVLRCTCRFLASSITSVFFSNLTISKINKEAAKHLKRMRQSAFIPLNVKTFILKPTIVHTASVVKSNPYQYYGDLQHDHYNPDPRYSALVAEHEMRQRVKAHCDEQRHFMVPHYGSLPWLARTCSSWLLGYSSPGSALHESIFLTVMRDFPRLEELVIGYEEPRTYKIVRTVAQDISIGLAKYLAGCGGQTLQILKMAGVWRVDLEILHATLRDAQGATEVSSPKHIEPSYSMPGEWPAVAAQSTLTASITRPPWRLRSLDINFSTAYDASKTSMASGLAALHSYTHSLASLRLYTDRTYSSRDFDPSLVGFRAPDLPYLQDIQIECFLVSMGAMATLLAPSRVRKMRVDLVNVSLVEGTWAEVARRLGKDVRFSRASMIRCGYLVDDWEWRCMDNEDREVWVQAGATGKVFGY